MVCFLMRTPKVQSYGIKPHVRCNGMKHAPAYMIGAGTFASQNIQINYTYLNETITKTLYTLIKQSFKGLY